MLVSHFFQEIVKKLKKKNKKPLGTLGMLILIRKYTYKIFGHQQLKFLKIFVYEDLRTAVNCAKLVYKQKSSINNIDWKTIRIS